MSDAVAGSVSAPPTPPPATRHWWAVALRGVFGILFGVVAVVQPFAALGSLVLLLGAYLLADGVFAIVSAVRAARHGQRWGLLLLEGVLNILAAGFAVFLPGITLLTLIWLLAGWSVFSGFAMLLTGFRVREGKAWLIIGGLLSVAWGVMLWISPIAGAVVLSLWLGIYALAFGFVLLVLGFRLRNRGTDGVSGRPAAA